MKPLTTNEFIQKANQKHNNKYSYQYVVYQKSSIKVPIVCPIHGIWQQRPNDHLQGCGCPHCKFDLISSQKRKTITSFIDQSNHIHIYEYDYTKVVYINAITKVCITCYIHGDFYQTPDKHLSGTGCPKCSINTSKGERKIQQCLDSLQILYEREKRFDELIGATSNSRLRYDFYLPSQNTLIEYDGEQHFSPINIKGRLSPTNILKKYEITQHNDLVKNQYAKNNGYTLIRIPYTDFSIINTTYIQRALGR